MIELVAAGNEGGEPHRFVQRLGDRLEIAASAVADPTADERDPRCRHIGARLAVAVEIAKVEQRFQKRRGAGRRIVETARNLGHRCRPLDLGEIFEDAQHAMRRLHHRRLLSAVDGAVPTVAAVGLDHRRARVFHPRPDPLGHDPPPAAARRHRCVGAEFCHPAILTCGRVVVVSRRVWRALRRLVNVRGHAAVLQCGRS